jgi:signal transduction histidine kinase
MLRQRNLQGSSRWTCLLFVVGWLILVAINPTGACASTEGAYVGQDFYAPSTAAQIAARSSGFTRLFLYALHVSTNGDIFYNNILVVQNGRYIGDPTWAATLAALKVQPTSIDRIEATIGGPDDVSFDNIRDLIAAQGSGTNTSLCQNLLALKNATGVDAIQFDDERTYHVSSAILFGRMVAALGLKVTLRPYTAQDFWVKVKSGLDTNVDAIYLECYDRSAANDPGAWNVAFGGFKVYPGLWGGVADGSTTMVTTKFRNWQNTLGITGGFIWLKASLPEDAPKWAQALSFGLDSLPSFRIVNRNSGKSIGVLGGGTFNGSLNNQNSYATLGDQQWSLAPTEDGAHYKIISWVTGRCVSIELDSMFAGGGVWIWDYTGDPSQQFDLVDAGNGWFKIKNVRSKLVLEVAGGSLDNGAPIQQDTDNNTANQQWKLYPYRDAVLAYDHFGYPPTASRKNGGEGWKGVWGSESGGASNVSAVGQSTSPAEGSAASGQAALPSYSIQISRNLDNSVNGNFNIYGYLDSSGFVGVDRKTVYISFLQPPIKGQSPSEFNLDRGEARVIGISSDSRTGDVRVTLPDGSGVPIGPQDTDTNLYVVRIDFKSGKDDIRVYRAREFGIEPDQPVFARSQLGDLSFNRVSLEAFTKDDALQKVQVRIATSWRDAIGATPEFVVQPSISIVSDDIFHRVRISAQVLYGRGLTYYLMDEGAGLYVLLNQPAQLEPGDIVDVMGLVQRKNQFVNLIEVTARKTGHSPLPLPGVLNLQDSGHQTPWVCVEGILTGLKDDGTGQRLEMQMGLKRFIARLSLSPLPPKNMPLASRLQLTGVYVALNGSPIDQDNVNSFELLLNSPDAIKVVARPPWWTLKRVMVVVSVLAVGLVLAFLWISQLRRLVELRTLQLGRELKAREQIEQKRVVEDERSRIARDIHDELGNKLTQISMLATHGPDSKITPEQFSERMRLILDRAQSLIISLDGVVWAVNPENDTLSSLVIYLAAYTEEFLAKTNIAYRVHTQDAYPAMMVAAEVRNNLLLSVKEAINNAVRHGQPSQMTLKFSIFENWLEIQVHDNGGGFDLTRHSPGNGLKNLQERMRKSNGRCEIQSSPEKGTTVTLSVPLSASSE